MIVTASVAAVATGLVAYAFYFDHQRRKNPEFRRNLRRNERRQIRSEKEEAQYQSIKQRQAIHTAIDDAKEEGFPTNVEEKEAYFLEQVSTGETLATDPSRGLEAALHFYKALKVYPTPGDLISIYDKTVSKPILDILAEMIAYDSDLTVGAFQGSSGIPPEMEAAMFGAGAGGMPPTVGLD